MEAPSLRSPDGRGPSGQEVPLGPEPRPHHGWCSHTHWPSAEVYERMDGCTHACLQRRMDLPPEAKTDKNPGSSHLSPSSQPFMLLTGSPMAPEPWTWHPETLSKCGLDPPPPRQNQPAQGSLEGKGSKETPQPQRDPQPGRGGGVRMWLPWAPDPPPCHRSLNIMGPSSGFRPPELQLGGLAGPAGFQAETSGFKS